MRRDSNEAALRLSQAKSARAAGAEPLAGERQATGADSGRLNQRYWRRQEQLRLAVEQAQRRSNETRSYVRYRTDKPAPKENAGRG